MVKSRAELALGELCTRLGYCLTPGDGEAILANPPPDAESFVDAVLEAEFRDAPNIVQSHRSEMLAVVAKWAVYELPPGAVAERPAFPQE